MVEIKELTKTFGDFTALDKINLTVPNGSAFGLLGSNGAGKSTILRLIAGIYKPENGKLLIDNEDVYDNENVMSKVFFINDETVQFSDFTLSELKRFYSSFYKNFSEDIFKKLCDKVNLPLDKKIGKFSKGMKRQSVVVIGLACQTEYLLLDEAFDGLDPTMRIIVKNMIVDAIIDRKLTTIISSHNLKEMNEICDAVALIHKGKIIANRQLDDMKDNIHKIQIAFKDDYVKEDFNDVGLLHFEKKGSIITLIVKGDAEMVEKAIKAKNPIVFDMIPLTLEEIFIYEMEGLGYDSNEIQ